MACSQAVEDIHSFTSKTLDLLALERQEELHQSRALRELKNCKTLEKLGLCLSKLYLTNCRSGLYGRTLLTFNKYNRQLLPAHEFTAGDIVRINLSNDRNQHIGQGVINQVSDTQVGIALDESAEQLEVDYQTTYDIIKLCNDVTYNRQKRAIKELDNYRDGIASPLIDIIYGNAPVDGRTKKLSQPQHYSDNTSIDKSLNNNDNNEARICDDDSSYWFNKSLNENQKQAVQFAVSQSHLAIIHGPPGTGKTTVVLEVILQLVLKWKLKVLACAPSNIAVDNMVEKLSILNKGLRKDNKVKFIRLGHPARLLNHLQSHSLDAVLSSADSADIIKDVRNDIDKAISSFHKAKSDRRQIRHEIKLLRKELKKREQKATTETLTNSDVILATLTGASDEGPLQYLSDNHVDVVIIDEAAQAIEASCWIALLRSSKCILAGDHLQLPPTILSDKAADKGLAVTLMERLVNRFDEKCVKMLKTQYRMNSKIMQWSSNEFYQNKLVAASNVANQLLRDLPNVSDDENTRIPIVLIDTAGCDYHEMENTEPDQPSRGNEYEVNLVVIHVEKLINAGVKPSDIGIITPYNMQVELLRLKLAKVSLNIEIKSVDGFQGREKEAIIISLVRSNEKGDVGFLSEYRRINVAVTRARCHLAVIGDSETVSKDKHMETLIQYFNDFGEVRSALQYIEGDICQDAKLSGLKDRSSNLFNSNLIIEENKSTPKTSKEAITKATPHDSSSDTASSPPTVKSSSVDKIKKRIDLFMEEGADQELSFPYTLSSYERRKVHEFAEALHLEHRSIGEGKERRIIIKKPIKDDQSDVEKELLQRIQEHVDIAGKSIQSKDLEITKTEVGYSEDVNSFKCNSCSKIIPLANKDLHLLRCHVNSKKANSNDKQTIDKKKGGKKVKLKPVIKNMNSGDDFDALIEAAVAADNHCAMIGCKKPVATLGLFCQHCRRRFCFSHQLPELHGCGQEARLAARKDFKSTSKSSSSSKNALKQELLQKKLNSKLQDMSSSRQGKNKRK
ncbi:DNA-binding protein SMUBP-2 [Trichoplax sp. H2]|nr:DNA-binding protein SMUBP-2 [Trichoplax sp. H2]|eukprot:RDD36858.1 DNA-binding protein SMUBP-2 [Trichoplax sp. H2]